MNRNLTRVRGALPWLPTCARFTLRGSGDAWRIRTAMTKRERLLLYRFGLRARRGAEFLEVGSYVGASACFLAAAAREIGGRAHCVDTWQNDAMSEAPRDTYPEFLRNTAPFSKWLVIHRGRSLDLAKNFDHQLALLFIDGDHSYEACRGDVLAWLPHLESDGVIVLHDYEWREGVRRVVKELIQRRARTSQVMGNIYWARM